MTPYAYICTACDHVASGHTLVEPGGELVAGPYLCAECPCEIRQDSPMYGLTRREFNARYPDRHPVPVL